MRYRAIVETGAPEPAIAIAERLRELGFAELDAFGPYPSPELEKALGVKRTILPAFVLAAAISGVLVAFAIQAWTNGVDYPIDVGGRPLQSWITDVPIAFETAALFGAVAAFVLMLVFSGLPRLHHPVFELRGFERTRVDRFWIAIGEGSASLDEHAREELTRLGALAIRAVEDGR